MSNKPTEKASIDFAEFLTEADPLIVSLPLKFSNYGAVLNVPKGVGTDSNEGFDLSRMKRPMLRLHNPHLKNKIRGRSRYWKELVLTKGFGEKLTKSQAKQIAGTFCSFSRVFAKICWECVITYAPLGGNGESGDDMPGVASVTSKPTLVTGNASDSTGGPSVGGKSPTKILLSPGFNATKKVRMA
ncbi:unnamed protein product [Brassica rapa subsp. trilocularis]